MSSFPGFERGMGIGGWLTNYKRFNVLPQEWRLPLSPGDFEHFATYITQRDVDYIASLGMDHIRLGFDQIVLEEYDHPGQYRDCIWQHLDNFAGWCREAGLHLVLNLHKAVGNYCDIQESRTLLETPELQERFLNLWLAVEDHFASRPDIAFELLNEVRNVPPELWNKLAAESVRILRAKNPVRTLILGSTCWNSPQTLPKLTLFDDPHIAYTWHCYAPGEFTHQQGVLQAAQLYYNRAMPYPGDIERYRDYHRFVYHNDNAYPGLQRMDKEYLREFMQPAFDMVARHPDKIFWCGEFGTIRHARLEYRENYMRDVISLLLEHHVPYCVWNYLSTPNDGNRFSLVDDDSRRILSPALADIIAGRI